jgi:hypothetical protein
MLCTFSFELPATTKHTSDHLPHLESLCEGLCVLLLVIRFAAFTSNFELASIRHAIAVAMKFSFAKKYLLLSQQDCISDLEDGEKSEQRSTHVQTTQARSYPTWSQWLPLVLTICLLLINSYNWVELRTFKVDNAVFCEYIYAQTRNQPL